MSDQTTAALTVHSGRPGFEGANIHTWIGFKHFMYQIEEAALAYCRDHGLAPQGLFQEHGLCLETVEARARLLHQIHTDDRIEVEVRDARPAPGELPLTLEMFVLHAHERHKALSGRLHLLLRRDDGRDQRALPADLAVLTHPRVRRASRQAAPTVELPAGMSAAEAAETLPERLRRAHGNAFVWAFRIPYFYCHYTWRLHYSGYVRLMEEVVERFLAARGISIRAMLDSRNWIPVVSEARLEILDEALLEETVYVVFTLEDILKDVTYTARVDWYVLRPEGLLRTATGRIHHGYVAIEGPSRGSLATFDAPTLAALRGERS